MSRSLLVLGVLSPVLLLASCALAPDTSVEETGPALAASIQDHANPLPTFNGGEHHTIASLDADGDGYTTATDCNDSNAGVHPGATELDDLLDQDCDTYVDEDFVSPGDLVITEVNRQARFGGSSVVTNGSWVEIYNTSSRTIDLSYWVFARGTSTAGTAVRVDPAVAPQVAPGGYVVFCDTNDYEGSAAAWPLSCDYVWGDETKGSGYKGTYHDNTFYLHTTTDTLALYVDGTRTTGVEIDSVSWSSGWPTYARFSMSLDPAYHNADQNDSASVWCATTVNAGGTVSNNTTWRWYDTSGTSNDEHGTPGAANYNCPVDPDADGDGYDGTTDCNDADPTINPGATETCDGVDEDCDGVIDNGTAGTTYYKDADSDTFGDPAVSVTACSAPAGYTTNFTDCNDASAISYPGAAEVCDGLDNNCDLAIDEGVATGPNTFYLDGDNDGYGVSTSSTTACLVPEGYSEFATDCDDASATTYPSAAELDDVSDNDCDGWVDEDYIQAGDLIFTEINRGSRIGATSTNNDASWVEVYNTSSRTIDLANWTLARGTTSSGNAVTIEASAAPVLAPGDYAVFCDTDNYQGSAAAYPLACDYVWGDEAFGSGYKGTYHDNTFYLHSTSDTVELFSGGSRTTGLNVDGVTWYYDSTNGYWPKTARFSMSLDSGSFDATLNGNIDAWCHTSSDATGAVIYSDSWRWYDVPATTYDEYGTPGTTNYSCLTDPDIDGDGYPASTDCDDTDPAVNPGATEVCNSLDDDCDGLVDDSAVGAGTWYADSDSDLYGDPAMSQVSCSAPVGYVADNTDCDDAAAYTNPGAAEVCDGADNDCDTLVDEGVSTSTWYQDLDSDNYGNSGVSTITCSPPSGYVPTGGDCADTDPSRYPGAAEVCNSLDDNCDGSTDEGLSSTTYADADSDGYGDDTTATTSCSPPGGYISTGGDCDDTNVAVNPAGVEVCGDGLDNDCSIDFSDCEWAGSQKVSDAYDFRAYGPDASQAVGHSIANNGDFDGDGYADVAVGRAYYDVGSFIDEGRMYLWYGPVDNTDTLTSADLTIDGDSTRSSDYFTSASRFVRDIDGDLDDELIVGAYASHSNDRGTAYLFKGGSAPTSVSSAYASFTISTASAYVGWDVDDGDIDNDGNGDVLISAYGLSSSAGAVDVWKAAAIGGGAETFGTDGTFHLTGAAAGDQLGYSAEIIDDIDGDGKDDVLIGAPAGSSSTSAGKAYLVYGADVLSGTAGIASAADATITGLTAADRLGMAVSGIGDTNGDGNFDFIVTADKNDVGAADAGAAYVITTAPSGTVSVSSAASSTYTGEVAGDFFGRTAAGIGDINADGFDDFAVGATAWDLGTISGAGCFILVYGPPTAGSQSAGTAYDARFTGSNGSDAIGYAITGGGDVNADGYDDFMTSATSWDSFGLLNAGAAWLYYGKGI